jgi:hypothetical protein
LPFTGVPFPGHGQRLTAFTSGAVTRSGKRSRNTGSCLVTFSVKWLGMLPPPLRRQKTCNPQVYPISGRTIGPPSATLREKSFVAFSFTSG